MYCETCGRPTYPDPATLGERCDHCAKDTTNRAIMRTREVPSKAGERLLEMLEQDPNPDEGRIEVGKLKEPEDGV